MSFSLNCLVLGKASTDIFRMCFGDPVPVDIKFKDLTVGDFMDALYENQGCKGCKGIIWKVKLSCNKINNFSTEDDIRNHKMSEKMDDPTLPFKEYYNNDEKKPEMGYIHIFIVPTSTSTAGPSQGITQGTVSAVSEEPLSTEKIIEASQKITNKDKPIITMYEYIERKHIQEFIRNRIEINLCAFEIGSARQNDYQGISISGGSGTGKTRHGFETINIIKDLKQIKDNSFEVIHIFVQIFPESSFVRFDERPLRNPSTGRYPRDPSHVNLVGHYLALAIASYYFTKNYQQESLQYFKELAGISALDLVTVLQAIRQRQCYPKSKKLLILLQLDEYQRDEYLIANILRYTSQLVANKLVCDLKILIVPICTGTAPTKLQESGHFSVIDYNVYDIHMSPMDIERSLNFMDSVIDHRMQNYNKLTSPISRENPLYLILIGAIKGIAVIMEQCALELLKMKSPLDSAEQAREIWRILVEWAKQKYSLANWLDFIGGKKDAQDEEDKKRKRAILMLMFWIHTQKSINKDTALNDSTVGDHEAGGLIFLEEINNMQYKAKAPLVLIASLVSHLELGFFDDIILDPFIRLDEESFPKFILHMHLITYRLADLVGIRQMTIEEIYFGCLLASNETLSKLIDIQPNVNYRSAPILKKKKDDDPNNPLTWNELIDHKKVSVITDARIDKVEDIDITTGHYIVLARRCSGSSDSLTPHAEEQYKFSSAMESGLPDYTYKPAKREFTLENFKKELDKATNGCECFIVMTVKEFKHEVSKLPSKYSTRTGIVFGNRFLKFMGIYGDFTRFIAEGVLEKTMDEGEEDSDEEMIIDD